MLNSDLLSVSPSALSPVDPCAVGTCGQRATTTLSMRLGLSARSVRLCEQHCRSWADVATRPA